MGQLQFKDMLLGKIDAYNEFLEYGSDIFKDVFFEYPNLNTAKILDGSVYYICGNKGTGKTMLLKYLETKIAEDDIDNYTEFIRFKKEIDEDQRNQLKRVSVPSQPFEEIIDKDIPLDASIDCTLAWQVYLIKLIVFRLENNENKVFDTTTPEWKNLLILLKALYNDSSSLKGVKNKIKKILPKIKKGNVELNFGCAKLDFELEWNDVEKKSVTFTYIAKQILELYSNLTPSNGKFYVLIDELELSLKKTKRYERDITLIRDLIFAIQYLSEIAKTNKYPVIIVAAIRNEVYKHVISKGMEINKTIHDYGVQISWLQKGGNINEQPLLKMLEKRIKYSEELKGLSPTSDVWKEYFTSKILNNEPQSFILKQTWYKPRDIIRLFTIIQAMQGEKRIIDQEIFERVRQRYSEESWLEFEETLTVVYSDEEVAGIKQALTGIALPFTVAEFRNQIDGKAELYPEVDALKRGKHTPSEILRDLYELGIIGNYKSVTRFVFLEDQDIDPLSPLTIHYPLIKYFGASMKKYDKKKRYVE